MQLSDLISLSGGYIRAVSGECVIPVNSIEYNSRRAVPGSVFVAIEGMESDGHRYIDNARENGASAIVVEEHRLAGFSGLSQGGVTVLASRDNRKALSVLSAAFFGYPSSKMMIIGVTGTNGKTSTTYMLESIMRQAGYRVGVIGTVNYRWAGHEVPAPNTTPESRDIQQLLKTMLDEGVSCVVMEVSSHGLELMRADDILFDAAIFTNLTRDHLDFHHGFEEYFAAKKRLFSITGMSGKKERRGIVNIDDSYGARIIEEKDSFGYPFVTFGIESEADYRPVPGSIRNSIAGIRYEVADRGGIARIDMRVAGRFNVYNSLCAFAAAREMGVPIETVMRGLSEVNTVPGRFDRIHSESGFDVIVDYAHTDDALEKLLKSARELAPRRLITIFGCGGNRDRSKRPIMGRIAVALSDHAIVTSDNPRNEEPLDIINDILSGIDGGEYEVIPDREEAIGQAISMAGEGDIVVIAGKGHEDYQILGGTKIHFDDREMARKFIAGREAR